MKTIGFMPDIAFSVSLATLKSTEAEVFTYSSTALLPRSTT